MADLTQHPNDDFDIQECLDFWLRRPESISAHEGRRDSAALILKSAPTAMQCLRVVEILQRDTTDEGVALTRLALEEAWQRRPKNPEAAAEESWEDDFWYEAVEMLPDQTLRSELLKWAATLA